MKNSIQWAFLLGLSIHVANATAAEHQYYKPFQGWTGTPLVEVPRPEGTYQFRTLQRYALADVDPFLIGSLTYIKAPKTGVAKEQSTKLVLETLRKQLGAKGWQVRHKGSATIYETYWAKANRGVRIYLKENDREIDYSIAVYRPAFADTVAAEAELMQQQLAGVLDQKLPWLERLMAKLESSLGIQSAFAITDPCGCLNYSGSDRNACVAACPFPTDLGTTTPTTTTPPRQTLRPLPQLLLPLRQPRRRLPQLQPCRPSTWTFPVLWERSRPIPRSMEL